MTQDYRTELLKRRRALQQLDKRDDRIAATESIIELADAHGDAAAGFSARLTLVSDATFGGRREKALVAFAWCLAHHDRTSPDTESQTLLWRYKWIVHGLPQFAAIPRERMNAALADMERRYRRAGYGLRAVHQLQAEQAWELGDLDEARRYLAMAQREAVDGMTDCAACRTNNQVKYHIWLGELDEALCAAAPIISGQQSCAEVPQSTYARLLLPLVKLERLDLALEFHDRNLKAVTGDPSLLGAWAQHLEFAAIIGDLGAAAPMAEAILAHVAQIVEESTRFWVYLACRLLALRLSADGYASIKFRLPEGFPGAGPPPAGSTYEVKTLGALFLGAARPLADAFNRRNGNDLFDRHIRYHENLTSLFTRYTPPVAPGPDTPPDGSGDQP